MTENTHTKKLTLLKLSVLGFGIFPLPGIIIMLIQVVYYLQTEAFLQPNLSFLQLLCFQIAFAGFLILALGIYSFSLFHTDKIEKEGKQISLLILIFFVCLLSISIFGFFLSLIMGDFQMVTALADIKAAFRADKKYRDWARMWAMLIILVFIFFFIITLRLSAWFNKVAKHHSIKESYFLIIIGIIYFIAALFTFLAISILFPLIRTTPLDRTPFDMARRLKIKVTDISSIMSLIPFQDVIEAQLISYSLLMLGFSSQFIFSIKLYLKLNSMSLIETKNQKKPSFNI